MILNANTLQIECDKAVKGKNYIKVYKDNIKIGEFLGITNFDVYSVVGGTFSGPEMDEITELQLAIAELAEQILGGN